MVEYIAVKTLSISPTRRATTSVDWLTVKYRIVLEILALVENWNFCQK